MASLSDHLPKSRDEWPAHVLAACAQFRSGSVVAEPPCFFFADPAHGVLPLTRRYHDENYAGPEVIDARAMTAPFGVLTSQTCDITEIDFDPPVHPFVNISPVYDGSDFLDGSIRKLLSKGKRIGSFIHLPALETQQSGFWIADLRLELPVEKSWLVGREPLPGFANEADARRLARALADIRERPAWAAPVSDDMQGILQSELKALKSSNRELFEMVVLEVAEVGARADSMLDPRWVQLAFFCDEGALDEGVQAWLATLLDKVRQALTTHGIEVHETEFLALAECTVLKYRQYVPIALARFSPQ